jgi:negative regulator of flagellin synthesis FlgM
MELFPMTNDISGINSSKPQQTSTQRSTAENGQKPSDAQPSQGTRSADTADKVSLTNTAEKLKALEKQLSQEAPVNEQKIANVRAALENGDYEIDPEKIAEKMLNFESNLDN